MLAFGGHFLAEEIFPGQLIIDPRDEIGEV
jgi:hypothetical protein